MHLPRPRSHARGRRGSRYNGGKSNGFLRSGAATCSRSAATRGRIYRSWASGAPLDGLRPLLQRDHGPDGAESPLPPHGRNGPADQHLGPFDGADDRDRLAARRLRGAYYVGNISVLSPHWGDKYDRISHPYSRFLADCKSGRLPHVAFVEPVFGGNNDHPNTDIRAGESFLNRSTEP